jgi:hypothetical protein
MPDSTTHWCALCLAERGIQTPAQVDWPGIPTCRECAAKTAARVSGDTSSDLPQPTAPGSGKLQ